MTNVVNKDVTSNRQRGLLEQVFWLLGFLYTETSCKYNTRLALLPGTLPKIQSKFWDIF